MPKTLGARYIMNGELRLYSLGLIPNRSEESPIFYHARTLQLIRSLPNLGVARNERDSENKSLCFSLKICTQHGGALFETLTTFI